MTLVFANAPDEVAMLRAWAEERIPHLHGGELPECQIAGVVRGGKVTAAVAFYNYIANPDGSVLSVSVATESRHWARPSVIAAIYHYAFAQAKAYTLEVATPLANVEVCKFLARIGFKQWGTRPHFYGRKQHQACFTLNADMWRRSKYFREI